MLQETPIKITEDALFINDARYRIVTDKAASPSKYTLETDAPSPYSNGLDIIDFKELRLDDLPDGLEIFFFNPRKPAAALKNVILFKVAPHEYPTSVECFSHFDFSDWHLSIEFKSFMRSLAGSINRALQPDGLALLNHYDSCIELHIRYFPNASSTIGEIYMELSELQRDHYRLVLESKFSETTSDPSKSNTKWVVASIVIPIVVAVIALVGDLI